MLVRKRKQYLYLIRGVREGSHLSNICDIVSSDFFKSVVGVGIDISKEGIMVASKNYFHL